VTRIHLHPDSQGMRGRSADPFDPREGPLRPPHIPLPAGACFTVTVAAVLGFAPPVAAEEPPELPVPVELPPSPHPVVQWTLTLDLGGGVSVPSTRSEKVGGVFHMAGHSLLLFGRKKANNPGFGFSMDVGTRTFGSLLAGGGLAFLIPLAGFLPIIVEGWPYFHLEDRDHGVGVTARLWWGIHGRNYIRSHVTVVGVYAQASRTFLMPGRDEWVVVAGLDITLILLLMPFVQLGSLIF